MATLTAAQVTVAGTTETLVAAGGAGDKVAPSAVLWLEVVNGSGGSINVTLDNVTLSNHGVDDDVVVAVPAGARKKINLGDATRFANPTDGLIAWTYSAVTSVTVGAFRM
jgi:hypothetical protein